MAGRARAASVHSGRIVGRAALSRAFRRWQRGGATRLAAEIRDRSCRSNFRSGRSRAVYAWRPRGNGVPVAAPKVVRHLSRFAVAHSLFTPRTLQDAIDRLGFVQADPIRSPARAQDLILRHRVEGY